MSRTKGGRMMPEFDLEAFRTQFEEEYQEPEETPEVEDTLDQEEVEVVDEPGEVEEVPTTETDAEEDELPETEDDVDSGQEPEVTPEPKKQSREENAAFAEMRRQNEALAKQAKIAEQVAAQYGMTVEQFEKAYAEQQEKARAEKQGIPVEVLRRLEQTEQKLAQTERESAEKDFWNSVARVKENYGLKDDEVGDVFEFLGKEGLVNQSTGLPLIDFDKAYKLANFDKIQARKEKESHQKRLAEKKARQQKSAIPPANAGTTSNSVTDEITDDFVLKRLKERNLI